MSDKKRVAVIYGGQSTEHEVSKLSAAFALANLDSDKYEVKPVYIEKSGESALASLYRLFTEKQVDCVFPLIHGKGGEDGLIAAMCEAAGLPYVGSNALSSAMAFDKHYTKIIANSLGLRQADSVTVFARDIAADAAGVCAKIRKRVKGAVFVKPSASGSSVGVSKITADKEFCAALLLAAKHGERVIAEEAIKGREIECAVLGGYMPVASGVGEILPANEFYDYNAKYNDEGSLTIVNPDLAASLVSEIREASVAIFRALGCYGMARVDFFVTSAGDSAKVVFNEINTIPGFTAISMYPMLWEASGISGKELLDRLIELAFSREA